MLPNSVQKFILKIFALDFICFSNSKCGINTAVDSTMDFGTVLRDFRENGEKNSEKQEKFFKNR